MNTSEFFNTFFENARYNGIIIMNKEGDIINVNRAFHIRFGYELSDLEGKNFSILFTEEDKISKKPEREIQTVLTEGSANDENYLVSKEGNKIWVTGESVIVEQKPEIFIAKVVHNIHAQKQLERFLMESHEFLDSVFDSIDESALLVLDSHLKVIKTNKAFVEMFNLKQPPAEGSRLSELNHPFWQQPDIRQELVNHLVMNHSIKEKIYELETAGEETKKISLNAKFIEGVQGAERKLVVMIKLLQ